MNPSLPSETQVVIVGGGISGLALAYRLEQLDSRAEVVLLERQPRTGGVIDTIERDGLLDNATKVGELLRDGVADQRVTEVRGKGLLIGLEFRDEDVAGLVISGMGRRRVIVAYYLSNPRVFRFEPPLIVERAHIDHAIAALRESIQETLTLLEGVTPQEAA